MFSLLAVNLHNSKVLNKMKIAAVTLKSDEISSDQHLIHFIELNGTVRIHIVLSNI